jgi:glycosyltransferase involved in cell wall biosynthesis
VQIALVAPLVAPIRQRAAPLGGAQSVLADLASGLVAAGHRVALLAADGSEVEGVELPSLGVDAGRLAPARFSPDAERSDLAGQREAFGRLRAWLLGSGERFELVHAHAFDAAAFELLRGLSRPVLHSLHLPPLDPGVVAAARAASNEASYLSVSEATAAAWRAQGVPVESVIPNGLAVEALPFGPRDDGYLLFAGRLAPEKGPDLALRAAALAGLPLVLVGGVYDRQFFASSIEPLVELAEDWRPGDPLPTQAAYLGAWPREALFTLMARARALLLPVRWEEPFGLVAIEAQATGCPVVAYRRGGLQDVVGHGRTGFLVEPDSLTGLVEAIGAVGSLSRADCRAWVAARFGLEPMIAAHERLYRRLRRDA